MDLDKCESISEKIQSTYYIKIYLDAAYFLCLSPFRLDLRVKLDTKTPYYSTKSWWPQKTFCAILTVLSLIWLIRDIRIAFPKDPKNPSQHFRFAMEVSDTVFKLLVIKLFWVDQNKVVNLVNFMLKKDISNYSHSRQKFSARKCMCNGLIIMYTGMALGYWITGTEIFGALDNGFNFQWWNWLKEAGKFNSFLFTDSSMSPEVDSLLASLAAVQFLQRRMLGAYADLFVLIVAVTLHSAVRTLTESLQMDATSTSQELMVPRWPVIQERYKVLKRLCKMINSMIGTNVTCLIAFVSLFFAVSLDAVFNTKGAHYYGRLIKVIFFYIDVSSIFLVSADICYQVCSFIFLCS